MFCIKEVKVALMNAPASIAVLIERLSSLGSGGSPGSNPGPDRTVFMYSESVNMHARKCIYDFFKNLDNSIGQELNSDR